MRLTPARTASRTRRTTSSGELWPVASTRSPLLSLVFAVAILAGKRPELSKRLADFRSEQAKKILEEKLT